MSQGHEEDEEPTLDSPGGSPEMDSATKHGLGNTQSTSSPEYLTIHAFDGRVVTRISAGTQTDWRHEEGKIQNVGIASEQSIPKNMKSELEISPDNEVLDSFSEETLRAAAACQGETEESLTNLDKISSSSGSDSSEEKLQTVLNIRCEHCQQPEKPPVTSHQIADSVDPQEVCCCEKARKLSDVLLKGGAVISNKSVSDRDPAMRKDQRVNLSPWGGTYCSDTGGLKKHWDWLDKEQHVHAPPYRTLALTLSPNLNIRIQSQEHICIAFTSGKRSVQLNVGAKLKLNQGKGLTLPGLDMLQRYLQQKSAEINALLQNIQSLIPDQKTVSPRKVKPQPSLISPTERRQLPMKQQQSAKKIPKADDGHWCEVTQTVLFTSFDFKCFQ
ncbi:hypothetical protein NQZ68_004275 [Dissostichus eleginoides]|nr:hypothetical protein NQZ68_004275 [Dissostichus eleginoides]